MLGCEDVCVVKIGKIKNKLHVPFLHIYPQYTIYLSNTFPHPTHFHIPASRSLNSPLSSSTWVCNRRHWFSRREAWDAKVLLRVSAARSLALNSAASVARWAAMVGAGMGGCAVGVSGVVGVGGRGVGDCGGDAVSSGSGRGCMAAGGGAGGASGAAGDVAAVTSTMRRDGVTGGFLCCIRSESTVSETV